MFKTRLLSGVILVILAILFIHIGGPLLLIVCGVISLIGLFELYRVFQIEKAPPGIVGYLAVIVYYLNLQFRFMPDILLLAMALIIALMCTFVFQYPKWHAHQIMAGFFGVFYVGVMISCVYLTRMIPDGGRYLVWLIFLCSWGCDTCAYCVGMLFGKHKMSPKLSPKKSVEGAFGGVIGAAILTMIFALIFQKQLRATPAEVAVMMGISAAGALISMVGDLSASAIKRNFEIKDYGKLIPGHGGILDRFDSVIFTAPIIYYLSLYFFR